jgi:3-isopropylmalate dehydrogenase
MGTYSLALLPGDGIGPEVVAEAVRVMETIGTRYGHTYSFTEALVGEAAIEVEGAPLSAATVNLCRRSDAVLFGAVGGAESEKRPINQQAGRAITGLRKELQLFANLRPVRLYPSLNASSPLRAELLRDVDLIVVRELTGGLYYGKPSEIRESEDGKTGASAVDTMAYSEEEIERIVRYAFEMARARRKHVTSVDKANVLHCSRLWRRVAERVAKEYPDVTLRNMLVDACAMELLRHPAGFDVIVTENTFGDILTDEASMLAGSLGLLPSASLGTQKTEYGLLGLYEPIHGTAPDITGQGIANPIATILSAALLLRYSLGLTAEAEAVERAVATVIESGYRTADIARAEDRRVSTREMGDAVIEQLTA